MKNERKLKFHLYISPSLIFDILIIGNKKLVVWQWKKIKIFFYVIIYVVSQGFKLLFFGNIYTVNL